MIHHRIQPLLDEYVTNIVSVIFVGDINVHLEKPLDSSTRAFNDLLQSLNFTQHTPPETYTSITQYPRLCYLQE